MKKNQLFLFVVVMGLGMFQLATAQVATKVVNGKTYKVHKVQSGETLYKISKTYGVTVAELQAANPNSATIKAGEELLVPSKSAESITDSKSATTMEHTVAQGETLSKIAREHGTTAAALKELNNLPNENIRVGQVIKVPAAVVAVVEDSKPQTQEEKPVQPQKPAPEKPVKPKPAVVKADVDPGMPASAEVVLTETATEKEDTGNARVVEQGMDQSRTFVMHPFLPKGSIIVVINEATGKMAYCRVVDNIRSTDLGGANLAITKAVAEKIGMSGTEGKVKIKYGTP